MSTVTGSAFMRGGGSDMAQLSNLAGLAPEVEKQLSKLVRSVATDVLSGVVDRTPVTTGRARANWRVALNKVDTTVEEPPAAGWSEAEATLMAMGGKSKLAKNLPPYVEVNITNDVDYMDGMENGSATQMPNGMVKLTVETIKRKYGK